MRWVSYLLTLLVFAIAPGVALGDQCEFGEPPGRQEETERDGRDREPVQPSTERIPPAPREKAGVPLEVLVNLGDVSAGKHGPIAPEDSFIVVD